MLRTYSQNIGCDEYPYAGSYWYVYTMKDIPSNANLHFTREDPALLMARLKAESGKDIWLIGRANLVEVFVARDLIDEYIITLMPTIVGNGIPLF